MTLETAPDSITSQLLSQRMAQGKIPATEALRYAMLLAETLRKLHDTGRAHGAVSPHCIQVQAHSVELLPAAPTAEAITPYTAPEILLGEPADIRTDIYSFGVILYEMLTGHPPFQADDPAALSDAIVHAEVPSSGSSALDRLASLCLAKNPTARFQRIQKLLLELKLLAVAVQRADSSQRRDSSETLLRGELQRIEARIAERLEHFEYSLTSVNDRIGRVEHGIEGIHERSARIEQAIEGVHHRASHIEQNLGGVHDRTSQIEQSLSGVHDRAAGIERSVETAHARAAQIEQGLDGIYNRASQIEQNVEGVHTRINGGQQSLAGIEERLAHMQQSGEAVAGQLSGLEQSVGAANHHNAQLAESVDAVQQRMAGIEESVGAASNRAGSLDEDLQKMRLEAAATRDVLIEELRLYERSLKAQAASIDSVRTAVGQTDDLVERVVEALESLQTVVLENAETRMATVG